MKRNDKKTHGVAIQMSTISRFTGMVIDDGQITPVNWELSFGFRVAVSKQEPAKVTANTFRRIQYWLDNALPGVIVVAVGDIASMEVALASANNMLFCPEVATSDALTQLLYTKLTSLCGGHLIITDLKLSSDATPIAYEWGPHLPAPLPGIEYVTPFVGEPAHSKPWWERNDGLTCDGGKPDEGEEQYDVLDEFDEIIKDMDDTPDAPQADVIPLTRWQPKKV